MGLIDFILNVAGLLLWLNWRAIRFDPFTRATPATLAGTLKRAEPPRVSRWHFLTALGGLLLARAIFYGLIGPEANWTPRINLGVVALPFPLAHRGHVFFLSALLFSALSFARTLMVFYFWLLAVASINRSVAEPDRFQKMLLLQLGRAGRWPRMVQAVLPLLAVAALWIALHPLLVSAGITSRVQSYAHLVEQGLLAGLGLYFSLKFLLPAFLFVHLIACYVYLGNSPLLDFIGTTAHHLLAPLRRLPLRLGRVDFAPVVGMVLILLLLHALPDFIVGKLGEMKLNLWPQ